jgi:hypothetical protein
MSTSKSALPQTCGAWVKAHPDQAGERHEDCKRLPRHNGECRPFLRERDAKAAERKAAGKGRARKCEACGRAFPRQARKPAKPVEPVVTEVPEEPHERIVAAPEHHPRSRVRTVRGGSGIANPAGPAR